MNLRKGDRVKHANLPDEHGIATIQDVDESARRCYVVWNPPEPLMQTADWEQESDLQLADEDAGPN